MFAKVKYREWRTCQIANVHTYCAVLGEASKPRYNDDACTPLTRQRQKRQFTVSTFCSANPKWLASIKCAEKVREWEQEKDHSEFMEETDVHLQKGGPHLCVQVNMPITLEDGRKSTPLNSFCTSNLKYKFWEES